MTLKSCCMISFLGASMVIGSVTESMSNHGVKYPVKGCTLDGKEISATFEIFRRAGKHLEGSYMQRKFENFASKYTVAQFRERLEKPHSKISQTMDRAYNEIWKEAMGKMGLGLEDSVYPEGLFVQLGLASDRDCKKQEKSLHIS